MVYVADWLKDHEAWAQLKGRKQGHRRCFTKGLRAHRADGLTEAQGKNSWLSEVQQTVTKLLEP